MLLPQGVTEEIYTFCKNASTYVFPNYDYRFPWEGKVGDALLWKRFKMPHPRTIIYRKAEHFIENHLRKQSPLPFSYPFVLKANWGGEGSMVFLIHVKNELEERILELGRTEPYIRKPGIILQEYIPTGGRDLRVVIIYKKRFYFWRKQPEPNKWKTNVREGGIIDSSVPEGIKQKVEEYLEPFLGKTGINLAAIDVLIARNKPLFLEINYYFGRRALGGSDRFYEVLEKEMRQWLNDSVPEWEKTTTY